MYFQTLSLNCVSICYPKQKPLKILLHHLMGYMQNPTWLFFQDTLIIPSLVFPPTIFTVINS